ncbi:unnamed protein product [Tilletia controversa]|uniref:ribonuclease Z n=3 Tax=Tilletia TaxID=13289 RepID=A0A8X7MSP8_9BASI|nr:hypothetical protein CF328_g4202 [Tilletia controversa]KAE8196941.1 hypothetical protein CF336_g2395 [Tilletia laevis]KAE8261071.1 hypothetical protein A4X03_0g3568 [Tilletia caries]KAE8206391.1 hypothetical protein CF335_g1931 [Tilletia laevis]KAE8246338.1 hypothetical protein A4X06_0g5055 [Tilletia controversa]
MISNLRILSTPSSDTPTQCFPVVLLHFDKARYVFNCPEGTVRSFGQHRISYGPVRTTFLASTANVASGGLPGLLITLAEAGHRQMQVLGPVGLKHYIATMRTYVRRHDSQLTAIEVDPRRRPPPSPSNGSSSVAKGKARDYTQSSPPRSPRSRSSSPKTKDDESPRPHYSDNCIDVFALQLLPQAYAVPPAPPNNDFWSVASPGLRPGQRASSPPKQQGEEQWDQTSKRHKSSHTSSPSEDGSIFDLPITANTFTPRDCLTPGSAHAQEWISGILPTMFFDALRSTRASRYEKVPLPAVLKTLCAPPMGPSMVSLPADLAPGINPTSSGFTPQPAPPLVLSYILVGKPQRGKFDPEIASDHGVSPGYLYSILAEGRSVTVARPKDWAEWSQDKKKVWFSRQTKKRGGAGKAAAKAPSPYNFDSVELEDVVVPSHAVVGPNRPGPIFIMLHVPSVAYIHSLYSTENLRQIKPFLANQENGVPDNQPAVVIVHTAAPQVLKHPTYINFTAKLDPVNPSPDGPQRDITHVITNQAYCADKLAYPSSNLLHLRSSQLDEDVFQVPDYELEGSLGLDTLFDLPEKDGTCWPSSWRQRTSVGFADMEISLYPRTPATQPVRNGHGAPNWDFYVGPRKEARTESDQEKSARFAAFDIPADQFEVGALDEVNPAKQTTKAAKKKARLEGKKRNEFDDPSRQSLMNMLVPEKNFSREQVRVFEQKRQARQVKEAAWQKFQSLAAAIREEIRLEEESGKAEAGGDDVLSAPQRRRLLQEGDGVVVTPLGTGSAMPSKYRNVSSTLIQLPYPPGVTTGPAPCILLDAGEGTYGQLRRKFGKDGVDQILLGLKLLFVSHIHADHHVGVSRLLIERRKLAHRTHSPLFVITNYFVRCYLEEYNLSEPLGLADSTLGLTEWQHGLEKKGRYSGSLSNFFLHEIDSLPNVRNSNLAYILNSDDLRGARHVALGETGDQAWIKETAGYRKRDATDWKAPDVDFSALRENEQNAIGILNKVEIPSKGEYDMDTYGIWRLAFRHVPHRFSTAHLLPALLESLNLESCETVRVDHGTNHCFGLVLRQKPILSRAESPVGQDSNAARKPAAKADSPRRGFSFAYSGDSRPCDALVAASKDVTLMIHEATIQDGREEMAYFKGHSTFAQAIDVGRRAGAACTLLTHFSQRYPKLPRLTRRWQGDSGGGPNMKARTDLTAMFDQDRGEGEVDDDDALLNSMNEAEQATIVKVRDGGAAAAAASSSSSSVVETKAEEEAKGVAEENLGMIVATAFDLASIGVRDMWKMERYVPALELLFDADEEEVVETGDMDADDMDAAEGSEVGDAHMD